VFSFFRDFVMEVFDSTLDVGRWKLDDDYWIFETNKVTTFYQDLTKALTSGYLAHFACLSAAGGVIS